MNLQHCNEKQLFLSDNLFNSYNTIITILLPIGYFNCDYRLFERHFSICSKYFCI